LILFLVCELAEQARPGAYSNDMASAGHSLSQMPQSMHSPASITGTVSASPFMHSTGHAPTQAWHLVHFRISITAAMNYFLLTDVSRAKSVFGKSAFSL
jgi:hypothetical protein